MLYHILLRTHSGLRWVFLLLILSSIFYMAQNAFSARGRNIRKLSLFTMIAAHIQLLLGFILYFTSPKVVFAASSMKDSVLRFFLVEHISLMLIAIILITLGYIKTKAIINTAAGAKKAFVYYMIGFILILLAIPWPFRIPGADWF